MTGAELIALERIRQIEGEGYHTSEDAEKYLDGELGRAALCYIFEAGAVLAGLSHNHDGAPEGWPWADEFWKPSDDPVRNLVKGAALIAAEIDRLQYLAENR